MVGLFDRFKKTDEGEEFGGEMVEEEPQSSFVSEPEPVESTSESEPKPVESTSESEPRTEKGLGFFQEFQRFQNLVESMNLRY